METPKRKAWTIPLKKKKQVLKLRLEDKMKLYDIAKFVNLSLTAVENIVYYDIRRENSRKYYLKNRDKMLLQMREYYKRTHKPNDK